MLLRELFYRNLNENLSKGSSTVLTNKKLVAAVADALRDDAMMSPNFFFGQAKAVQKMDDETATKWFLEQIDKMEQQGYQGVVFSRDGRNNLWIAQNYAALRDTWEDITGKMQSVLFDFYLLKNRDMLDPNHVDIMKFKSIRELGMHMVTHYSNQLEQLRRDKINEAKFKLARAAKIVGNDEYDIYVVLNRLGAQKLARGALWCTGMTNTDVHFKSYSSRAMLFNLFPKQTDQVELTKDGKKITGQEKYQFDAGGPYFMDIADRPVNKELMKEKFPYLYDDLVNGLSASKAKLEELMDGMSDDPTLNADSDSKTLNYDVDAEIQKLGKFLQSGHMQDTPRPPPEAQEPEALPEPVPA